MFLRLVFLALASLAASIGAYHYPYHPASHGNYNRYVYSTSYNGLASWLQRLAGQGGMGTRYQLVQARDGRGYYLVIVPQNVKRPTTTTTTTPKPFDAFFSHVQAVSVQIYSNFICSVYQKPLPKYNHFHGMYTSGAFGLAIRYDSTRMCSKISFRRRLIPIANWLQQRRPYWSKYHMTHYSGYPSRYGRNRRDHYGGYYNHGYTHGTYKLHLSDQDYKYTLNELRMQLLSGMNQAEVQELRYNMSNTLTTNDLENIIFKVYQKNINLVKSAASRVVPFYVKETGSTQRALMDKDLRELYLDIIFTANALLPGCEKSSCNLYIRNADGFRQKLMETQLPMEMTSQQKALAIADMKYLADSGMDDTKTNGTIHTFVQGYVNEVAKRSILDKRGIQGYADNHQFNLGIVCFVLKSYHLGSLYCGMKHITNVMFEYLQCHKYILITTDLDKTTTPAPTTLPPTTTTTQAPTTLPPTTTTTTTTTPKPETTTPQPTTSPSPTDPPTTQPRQTTTTTDTPAAPTTTPPQTTTTTPAPTTTPTTTPPPTTTSTLRPVTTTTPSSPTCGVSGLATMTSQAAESAIFVTPRVVGGHLAGDCRAYPWMVRLQVNQAFLCGAAILDERHILTAAHCLLNLNTLRAFVGEYDSSAVDGFEQVFDIDVQRDVFPHEQFSFLARTNDIGVVKLPRPIDLSKPCATPICLDPTFAIQDGTKCDIAGWGRLAQDGEVSRYLMAASVQAYNATSCGRDFTGIAANYFTDPANQLCAGNPVAGGVDTCTGDSGGPLMCQTEDNRWVAVGVTSYGAGCGGVSTPGVYTTTARYHDWILQQLNK